MQSKKCRRMPEWLTSPDLPEDILSQADMVLLLVNDWPKM
jgi:hypothetical protein